MAQAKIDELNEQVTRLEAELEEYRSIAERIGAEKAVSARDAAKQQVARLRAALKALIDYTDADNLTMQTVVREAEQALRETAD